MTVTRHFGICKCLAVLAIAFLGVSVAAQEGDSSRSEKTEIERFQESGLPQTIAELKPEGTVADRDNAAWWLAQADEGRRAIDMQLAANHIYDQPCSPEFIRQYREVVEEHPDVYERIFSAVAARHYIPELNFDAGSLAEFDFMEVTNRLRSWARVLNYRASVEWTEGHVDSAVISSLAVLKLARLENTGYGMAGYQTRQVVAAMGLYSLGHTLQSGKELKSETIDLIREELEKHDTLQAFQKCFESERVIGIQMLKDQGVATAALRMEGYLKAIRAFEENANQTIAEREVLVDAPKDLGIYGGMISPSIQSCRGTAHRTLALVRCLRILIELQNSMHNEPTLDQLDLPAATKTDPVSGKPVVILKEDGGWLVYCLGRNRMDDGGKLDTMDSDIGFAPHTTDR